MTGFLVFFENETLVFAIVWLFLGVYFCVGGGGFGQSQGKGEML